MAARPITLKNPLVAKVGAMTRRTGASRPHGRISPPARRHHPAARWVRGHRPAALTIALLFVASVVTGAVLIRQDIAVSPSAQAPDVVFGQGTDYAAINAAGYATVTVGSSATSATFSLNGIPGAALVQLGDVLTLENTDVSQAYDVTLKRSADPNAAIDGFDVQVYTGADALVESFDAANAASGTQFSLPAATTYDITIEISIVDGTAAGALGSFDLQFELVPA